MDRIVYILESCLSSEDLKIRHGANFQIATLHTVLQNFDRAQAALDQIATPSVSPKVLQIMIYAGRGELAKAELEEAITLFERYPLGTVELSDIPLFKDVEHPIQNVKARLPIEAYRMIAEQIFASPEVAEDAEFGALKARLERAMGGHDFMCRIMYILHYGAIDKYSSLLYNVC